MKESERYEDYGEKETERYLRYFKIQFKRSLRKPKFVLEVVGFLVLVVYAFYTIEIYKANQESADVATKSLKQSVESLRIDQRAWIAIEPFRPVLKSRDADSATYEYQLIPKNVGKTSAYKVSVKTANPFDAGGLGISKFMVDNIQDKVLLGKIEGHIDSHLDFPTVLSPNSTPASPIYFKFIVGRPRPNYWPMVNNYVGRIDYEDIFGVPHWRKFCFIVAGEEGNLGDCAHGNDEDRNPESNP
jgi:hypothetical protein